MPPLQGLSAHGLSIKITPSISDPTGAAAWVAGTEYTLQGIGDVTGIGTTRNDFDITPHDKNIDQYIFGVPRRAVLSFPLFYNKAITTHRMLRTLQANNDVTTQMSNGFKITSADGQILVFSGGVKDMPIDYPVDGPQKATVSIRATGNYILDAVEYGS